MKIEFDIELKFDDEVVSIAQMMIGQLGSGFLHLTGHCQNKACRHDPTAAFEQLDIVHQMCRDFEVDFDMVARLSYATVYRMFWMQKELHILENAIRTPDVKLFYPPHIVEMVNKKFDEMFEQAARNAEC